ncbi:hypothetical protein [Cetobacterium somerae]|uniref:hypothetical protein n=1 Tax=Cetobacterium somerae TaxID=188913 RepID=UPI00389166DA
MKKVLLGLLALSAVSMAAPITNEIMNGAPVDRSSVFESGQTGILKVSGNLVSIVPVLKYVVYAGDAAGTEKDDTLTLPEFKLTQSADTNIFDTAGQMKTVYVKRITANGATAAADPTIEDLTTEKVSFKVVLDSTYTAIPGINTEIVAGSAVELQPTNFYSKTELEGLLLPTATVSVNDKGLLATASGETYQTPNSIYGESKANGEFSFTAKAKTDAWGTVANAATIREVETMFAQSRAFESALIHAKVGF